jgi:hypothetical protein
MKNQKSLHRVSKHLPPEDFAAALDEVVGSSIVPDMVDEVNTVFSNWSMGDIVADEAARGTAAILTETDRMRSALEALSETAARPTIAPASGGSLTPTPDAGVPRVRTPRTTPSPSPATSRPARQQRERDAEAVGEAVEDALRNAGIELNADEDRLKELGVEGARLVIDEQRERDNRAIQRGRRQ